MSNYLLVFYLYEQIGSRSSSLSCKRRGIFEGVLSVNEKFSPKFQDQKLDKWSV